MYTDVSYGGKQPKATNNDEKSDTESDTESDNGEKSDTESDTKSDNGEKATNNESDTESDTEEGTSNTYQSPYHDNMLLDIPLESYLPQPTVNSSETAPPSNNSNDYDYEVFSDERLQEIVAELRNDPELRNIFDEPENVEEEDEGVELPSLEEGSSTRL